MKEGKFQTLKEFIDTPFGHAPKHKAEYENTYAKYNSVNSIRLIKILDADTSIYYHFKVVSESTEKIYYDVVIQFIAPDSERAKSKNIDDYYVKFFSNSPGFVYKYAALYKHYNYLADALADLLGNGIDQLPTKTNADMELDYDKTIYLACRYIMDHKYTLRWKDLLLGVRTKNLSEFTSGITDFEVLSVKIDSQKLEKSIEKQIKKEREQLKKNPIKLPEKPHSRTGNNIKPKKTAIGPKAKKAVITPAGKKAVIKATRSTVKKS